MDDPSVIAWATRLIYIAAERTPPVAAPQPIDDPFAFFVTLLAALTSRPDDLPPPTRNGIDAMMDELFANPAMEPLLIASANYQDEYEHSGFCPPELVDHWTYVIRPAWSQHTDAWRLTHQPLADFI
jgi:hypothetical protein